MPAGKWLQTATILHLFALEPPGKPALTLRWHQALNSHLGREGGDTVCEPQTQVTLTTGSHLIQQS